MADVALIQEPWAHRGQIRALTSSGGTIFSVVPDGNARSYIYARDHINALPLLELCSRDATTVRIYKDVEGVLWSSLSPQHTFNKIQMNHCQLSN
jgi:hypothetical protein